ncbi:hypothetical protein O1D97_19450 [Marinomonas sp. 15G1-11]|uniref:Membrane-anchored protein n=1 Tax=Marinomonas phaeophyticola TaxID=3004091 RepID=A0ABT4JZK7_9GAMM|nr:hypothetical protein [Marinomonas sp. 15G1-11]MCZ2723733.1 hypothetical protein [Marinomonas sp. 15G1-11]
MTTHNHFHLLEKYRTNESTINDLLSSILTSLDGELLLDNVELQQETIKRLTKSYPFVELLYCLDVNGIQQKETIFSSTVSNRRIRKLGKGSDRSHRPYFQLAKSSDRSVVVTQPYLSSATYKLSVSSVQHFIDKDGGDIGYLVINFNLVRLISYLLGDERRARLHPLFQSIYGMIGGSLILVSLWLLSSAFWSLFESFSLINNTISSSFGVVVMITLGLAVFDLGKTILEEEVLFSKDINHYNSTRRTLMRFMSAIIIAVSIEALLLMFKSVLSANITQLMNGVWMLWSGVGLLAGLGLYLKLSRDTKDLQHFE